MSSADLIIDAKGPDIRHAAGITAPDAFFYLKQEQAPATVFFDAREYAIQRQRLETLGNGVMIERLEPYLEKARALSLNLPLERRALLAILETKGIAVVHVSPDTGYGWVKAMLDAGIRVEMKDFALRRRTKSEAQLQMMKDAQHVTEGAYDLAVGILRESTIQGDHLMYQGEVLTSERMKAELKRYFLDRGFANPEGMIVASGEQTSRPHDDGAGPILANRFIIIDIFPQSETTGFFADMTRTFVKGIPSDEMRVLYQAVQEVQQEMIDYAAVGVRCSDVYARTVEAFAKRQYETSSEKGFMHRTGHGLGLSVHEEPSFGADANDIVQPGMAMTIEPGLYYPGVGGARIEDVIVFHEDGTKENINRYSKDWIIP